MAREAENKLKSGNKTHWSYSIISGAVFGILVTAFMMYAAWNHNPQGEIHSPGNIEWCYWLLIGFSWFISVFVLVTVISRLMIFLVYFVAAKKQNM